MIHNWPCPIRACVAAFCRDNCRLFRPSDLGGCLTCRAGFTGAPECCECEPDKTEVNGVCSKCHIIIYLETVTYGLLYVCSFSWLLYDLHAAIEHSTVYNQWYIKVAPYVQSVMPTWSLMEPVQKVLSNQTAVSVTQLEMKPMPSIRLHLENANVSSYILCFWRLT